MLVTAWSVSSYGTRLPFAWLLGVIHCLSVCGILLMWLLVLEYSGILLILGQPHWPACNAAHGINLVISIMHDNWWKSLTDAARLDALIVSMLIWMYSVHQEAFDIDTLSLKCSQLLFASTYPALTFWWHFSLDLYTFICPCIIISGVTLQLSLDGQEMDWGLYLSPFETIFSLHWEYYVTGWVWGYHVLHTWKLHKGFTCINDRAGDKPRLQCHYWSMPARSNCNIVSWWLRYQWFTSHNDG